MNEDELIQSLTEVFPARHPFLKVGVGDDCAVLRAASGRGGFDVLKTDAVVQDVHFTLKMPPRLIGRKALARVLSDFAAMGAEPRAFVVTVGIPKKLSPRFIKECYRGMNALATRYNIALAGGEMTRSRELWFSVAATGRVRRPVLRSTARAGDALFVTGRLGGSFPKEHLCFEPRLKEGQWLARKNFASAMMDLSDGLGKDLPRLARASGLSFEIRPTAVPCRRGCSVHQAVNDGEDYELLFTVAPSKADALRRQWPFRAPLTCIGKMRRASEPVETGGVAMRGFDHFRQ
ncbi:MAG: thiamine-phosphate kinase [bacterium]